MTEEQQSWQEYLPIEAERCPTCQTTAETLSLWREAEATYQRQMDPTQHDGKPERRVRSAKHALSVAIQRRRECRERHEDE